MALVEMPACSASSPIRMLTSLLTFQCTGRSTVLLPIRNRTGIRPSPLRPSGGRRPATRRGERHGSNQHQPSSRSTTPDRTPRDHRPDRRRGPAVGQRDPGPPGPRLPPLRVDPRVNGLPGRAGWVAVAPGPTHPDPAGGHRPGRPCPRPGRLQLAAWSGRPGRLCPVLAHRPTEAPPDRPAARLGGPGGRQPRGRNHVIAAGRSGQRPIIEVLYVQDCPHYPATLALVERMRAELGIDAELRPSLIVDQAAAEHARFPGSPTVRVDSRDVEPGSEPATEYIVGCRLYRLEHRFAGQPEERWIRQALLRAVGRS